MKIKCELTENRLTVENVSMIDYGLRFFNSEDSYTVCCYNDLFCSKEYAGRVVELINSADISEVHIEEIIEDLIVGY